MYGAKERSNPELISRDHHCWFFRCEGPGFHGLGCPDYRERFISDLHDAERDLVQSNWQLLNGRWHCEACAQKVGGSLQAESQQAC